MELTTLDTDLIRLEQTLEELIAMGLVKAVCYAEVDSTRYRPTGRPGDDDEQEEEEAEMPAHAHAVGA